MERFDLLLKNFEGLNTELKVVVSQLKKENEDVFNAIVENSPIFIAIVQNGKYVFLNSFGIQLLKCKSSTDIIGKHIEETIAIDSRVNINKRLSTAYKLPNKPTIIKVKKMDGTYFYSESNSIPFSYNKRPAALIIGRDVTSIVEQKSLVEREEKLRTDILNSFKDIVAFYSPDHHIIWMNEAGKQKLNVFNESYVGKLCHKVWFGSDNVCTSCPIQRGEVKYSERIVTFPDKTIWKVSHTPLMDSLNNLLGYIEYREDITEKEQVKAELEKSHARLVHAETANKFGHFEFNLDSGKQIMSKGLYKILELSSPSGNNKQANLIDFVHPEDLSVVKMSFDSAYQGKNKLDLVFRIVDSKGTLKSIRGIGDLLEKDKKKKGIFFGVFQDVSGLINLQKQVVDERERYRMLAENAPFGLILTQKERAIYINKILMDWLGIETLLDYKIENYVNYFHPTDQKLALEMIKKVEDHNIQDPIKHDFRIIGKSGSIRYLRFDIKEYSIDNMNYVQTVIIDNTSDVLKDKKLKKVAADALYINQKNKILTEIESEILKVVGSNSKYLRKDFSHIFDIIGNYKHLDKDWDMMVAHFNDVHPNFFNRLQDSFPNLSTNDIKHCACIKMNFDTKEIARFFNIKASSVQIWRVRLKKKMHLLPENDLRHFILGL